MSLARTNFQYPESVEETVTSPLLSARQFRTAYQLHGAGDVDALFKGHAWTTAPFPRAPRNKRQPLYDHEAVRETLASAPELEEIDSRHLFATQREVTRPGVNHYLTGDYEATGRTYADHHDVGNQYPVVYTNRSGHNIILSGHHRGTASLLRGRPLLARRVRGEV